MTDYHYVGEHVIDGVVYDSSITPHDLLYIRDEMVYKEDDIVVATYPKAGTTWVQEIIWLLHHGPGSADRRQKPLDDVFPYVELNLGFRTGLDLVKKLPRPRFIKTHLQATYFRRPLTAGRADCPRFVVVVRNPKDVLLSYYNFHKMWPGEEEYPGNVDDFFALIRAKRVLNGDYADHALGWWRHRDHPKVHFVKYEELKKDPHSIIRRLGEFLGKSPSDDDLDSIVKESSFDAMKKRPTEKVFSCLDMLLKPGSEFFHKGEVGRGQTAFTDEQNEYVDKEHIAKCAKAGLEF